MNCFPFATILSFHSRKIYSGVRRPLQIIRGQDLPKYISPQQTVEDTPKFSPHVVRFELKIAVALLLTEEKRKANLWFMAQIKHWGGWWSFWKPIAGGLFNGGNCFSQSDSPLEIQINFAYRLLNSFSKTNYPEWNSSERLAEDAPMALQLSQSLWAKRQVGDDFAEQNSK